ncbi:hypothetical protein BBJ28_00013200 [Nothophytophthora sp. Chile5]|nr:hypothetical protein BBJ28_00013200 [Nothophytophthora sp. Chile5]
MMAHIVGFPVPFMWQVEGVPIGLFTPIMLVLVLGRAPFASDSPFRPQFQRFNHYFFAYLSVIGLYPFVRVLYDLVPESYRSLAVLLVPLWKFAAKHFVIRAMGDLEDFIPPGAVLALLQEQRTHQDHHQRHHGYRQQNTGDLVTPILSITRDPRAFNIETMKGARLWACLAHPIPDDRVKALNTLEALTTYGPDRPLSGRTLGRAHPNSRRPQLQLQRAITIVPASVGPKDPSFASPATLGPKRLALEHPENEQEANMTSERAAAAERSNDLVVQGLQLLFHCEYLTLVEYVECIVPLVLVVYKYILQQLQDAIYYPGRAGRWGLATVANVLVFATLEVVSFLALNALVQRKFAFPPLYQLAFVLETEMYLVQATLFTRVRNTSIAKQNGDLAMVSQCRCELLPDVFEKVPSVWRKLLETASGVHFLHERHLVTSDLKRNQILVSKDEVAKFGLTQHAQLPVGRRLLRHARGGDSDWSGVVGPIGRSRREVPRDEGETPAAFQIDAQWEFVLASWEFDASKRLKVPVAMEQI